MKSLQYLAMALGVEVVNGEAGTAKKYGVSKAFKKIDKTVNGRFRSNTTTNQMRYHFIIICIFICGTSVYGQSVKQKESKFYNITEIGYGLGIGKIKLKNSNQKIDNDGYSVRLRTQFGYFLSRQFSLGLGLALMAIMKLLPIQHRCFLMLDIILVTSQNLFLYP